MLVFYDDNKGKGKLYLFSHLKALLVTIQTKEVTMASKTKDVLVQLMAERGLTQSDIARALSVRPQAVQHGLKVENLQAFIVTEDALSPFINEGDVVTIDKTQTVIENGRVYAFALNGQLHVRRLRVLLNGDLQTIPSDSRSVETIPKDQIAFIHILGKVVDRSGSNGL